MQSIAIGCRQHENKVPHHLEQLDCRERDSSSSSSSTPPPAARTRWSSQGRRRRLLAIVVATATADAFSRLSFRLKGVSAPQPRSAISPSVAVSVESSPRKIFVDKFGESRAQSPQSTVAMHAKLATLLSNTCDRQGDTVIAIICLWKKKRT